MKRIADRVISLSRVNWGAVLLFVLAGVVSFYLRHKILPILSSDPLRVLTITSDSSYFMRQLNLALAWYPHLSPSVDFYSNYPWGLKLFLPPIWAYMLATIAIPVSHVFHIEVARAVGLFVIILAMTTAVPVYFLAREMFDVPTARASAIMALFLPYMVFLGDTGIDHHVADVALLPTIFLFFLLAKRYISEGHLRKGIIVTGVGGGFIALTMLISLSSILMIAITALPVAIGFFILSRDEVGAACASLAGVFGSAALIFTALALTTNWFSPAFEFGQLSYLHIIVLAVFAVVAGLILIILKFGIRLSILRALAGVALLAVIMAMVLKPSSFQVIFNSYYRSIGSIPLLRALVELSPLLQQGILQWPVTFFSYFILALPVIVISSAIRDWRTRRFTFERLFYYSMLFALGFYTLEARYYAQYLAGFIAITYGLGISLTSSFIASKIPQSAKWRTDAIALAAITALAAIVMALPITYARSGAVNANVLALADYIKTHTVKPGDFYQPAKKPAYGIMCKWGQSFRLEFLSERPTVGTCITDTGIQGIMASERFYQSSNEDEALSILRQSNARYVVAGRSFGTMWKGDTTRIGDPTGHPDDVALLLRDNEISDSVLQKTMGFRLFSPLLGLAEGQVEPLHHLRIVFISDKETSNQPFILYEVVKGANITMRSTPNSPFTVWTKLSRDNGMSFMWATRGTTDSNGFVQVTVPYPTKDASGPGSIHAEPYHVQIGDNERRVNVTEQDIINGSRVVAARYDDKSAKLNLHLVR